MAANIAEHTIGKNFELKKHVAIIHSHSRTSLLQRKIANVLLFHAYENLLIKDEHEIHIKELVNLIGYDSNDHKKVKTALIELLSTVVEWNIVDGEKIDEEGVWNASSIIADASISGSICTYSYSNKMKKLLYHPKIYGRLNLSIQTKFQSSYGLALYENCNRYQEIGRTPLLEINKFRKLMGVDENKYKIFRDLKTRVINKAVEEVNKHSPLYIEPKIIKTNRQVTAIQFIIKTSNIVNKDILIENDKLELKQNLIQEFKLSQKDTSKVLNQFDEDYIKEKITLIKKSKSYKDGTIKNIAKYLLSALNDDYQPTQDSDKKSANQITMSQERYAEYNKYIVEYILNEFRLNPNLYADHLESYENKIDGTTFKKLYLNNGLKDPIIKNHFVGYILSFENELAKKSPTCNEWLSSQIEASTV